MPCKDGRRTIFAAPMRRSNSCSVPRCGRPGGCRHRGEQLYPRANRHAAPANCRGRGAETRVSSSVVVPLPWDWQALAQLRRAPPARGSVEIRSWEDGSRPVVIARRGLKRMGSPGRDCGWLGGRASRPVRLRSGPSVRTVWQRRECRGEARPAPRGRPGRLASRRASGWSLGGTPRPSRSSCSRDSPSP